MSEWRTNKKTGKPFKVGPGVSIKKCAKCGWEMYNPNGIYCENCSSEAVGNPPSHSYRNDPDHDYLVRWFHNLLTMMNSNGGIWVVPYLNAMLVKIDSHTILVRNGPLDDKMRYYVKAAGFELVETADE